jgi:transposase
VGGTKLDELRRRIVAIRRERDIATNERDCALARVHELEDQVEALQHQLAEMTKLSELQKADLDRFRTAIEAAQPNRPERVPANDLQLAFARVLETFGLPSAANDRAEATGDVSHEPPGAASEDAPLAGGGADGKGTKRRHSHGRRPLDLSKLPVDTIEIDPEEVKAAGGAGFQRIGAEISERVAFKRGGYVRLRIVRGKWVAIVDDDATTVDPDALASVDEAVPAVRIAALPESVWPNMMADPSAITQIIVSKYDDCLPLHRQERITSRHGFVVPRSTQCGWLGAAYSVTYRIVDAMFTEAKATAFCIATDATGVRVRLARDEHAEIAKQDAAAECASWHVFVFIADRDHVVFRYSPEHTGPAIASMLDGFQGHLLADAAPIFDVLFKDGNIVEHACWFHARRYWWRALESDRERALEPLAIISKLFDVERECKDIPMPARTQVRAARAGPILDLLDRWIDRHRDQVDPRGPLDKAITYYDNQHDALRAFLTDGRIRLDNSISEQQLRHVVLGRHNWNYFANETGLRWYTAFRSLIASCALHGLNSQLYLEQVLRLAPHWPVTRMLELAPKYWASTRQNLDARQRTIITCPWDLTGEPRDNVPAAEPAA